MLFYSASNAGFYDGAMRAAYDVAGTWPSDVVEISEALHAELLAGQSRGQLILAGQDGLPECADMPQAPIESLRVAARERINVWRDQQELAVVTFTHADHRWDGGLAVRERLNTTLATLKAVGVPDGFFWTDADNIDVPMGRPELQALFEAHERAIFGQGWKIHQRQREMKLQIDAANAAWLQAFVPDWPSSPQQ
ncbi:DUF4376 domain-containing protein [Jeongeupia chitinilytica]|uniref:DUF4376 domain-containing protein n=1 Tax=Jeongeupia chitinilytica TaxID=1041641 RepID=A0ABQ3GZB4_9NEIS|nr:DUF4376 domain-containing protein [Jeongeupia chitinilytica]GHD59844.1 hypothetical protein GCM10007350_11740 [Jeongeupia chitinilytica]